jgi:hypothetical protein
MHGRVRSTRRSAGTCGRRRARRGLGQQDGLVVAALPEALGVHGTATNSSPPMLARRQRRQDGAERARDASIPGVLSSWSARRVGPVNGAHH